MTSFLHRFGELILGTLSGFDRLRLRGTLPRLAGTGCLYRWLEAAGILLKDFPGYAEERTEHLRSTLDRLAKQAGRPVEYLPGYTNKEARVQERRERDGVAADGLICAFSTLENCVSYDIHKNAQTHMISLRRRPRKCLHYYVYFDDSQFGLTQVRVQTWFPFSTHVVLNGREWLAKDFDKSGLGYLRRDNCFAWVEDFAQAQHMADQQPRIPWEAELNRVLHRVLPESPDWFPNDHYYWTVEQSEWATDLAFRDEASLGELYPRLIRHGIETFRSEDVLRFLGRRVTSKGRVAANLADEITSDLKHRPEGVRIKHRAGRNTIKVYDKQGTVLRVETTLNEIKGLKSYRPRAADPEGPRQWQPMRKSVSDMTRRADLSQASNERYLEALGTVTAETPLKKVTAKLCQAIVVEGRRFRGLNPLSPDDGRLLETISGGQYLIAGFRNRDVRRALYGEESDEGKRRRQAAAVTRLLGMLRAHGLIKKVPRTHRYLLSTEGTAVIPALLAANNATLQQLKSAA